jgi:hypothetical protein
MTSKKIMFLVEEKIYNDDEADFLYHHEPVKVFNKWENAHKYTESMVFPKDFDITEIEVGD